MTATFTICSNNYFAQALVLAKSFLYHHTNSTFFIILADKKHPSAVSNDQNIIIIEIGQIEKDILNLAKKYDIIELNTAVKPAVFTYLFTQNNFETIIYLDPDIYVYRPFTELLALLVKYDIILTPHALSPIPADGKKPFENDFLNFGIYNLGFLALKKTAGVIQFLNWWKERTYTMGYINLALGLFVDQLWMNLVPVYFHNVHILKHPGYNMAPWNLHERKIDIIHHSYRVNETNDLYFYHFSSFNPLNGLKKIHRIFNRYDFGNRPDLIKLYGDYARMLIDHGFKEYSELPCYYVKWRERMLAEEKLKTYRELPSKIKIARRIKKIIPKKIRDSVFTFIQS
jgi:hypothetical protein